MVTKPELITYCANQEELDHAVKAGADHLILDHPAISLCSWIQPRPFDNFESLQSMIRYSKKQYPNIRLSVNCDVIIHQTQLPLIDQLAAILKETPVDFIRVQDIGLLYYFSKWIPTIYHAQMGNSSYVSVSQVAEHANRQTLSMDLPHSEIAMIKTKTQADLEVVVHGHCLIQYSQRRFLSGLENQSADQLNQIHLLAEDEDYPGRRFTFLDNPHGHFMFAYFERSLLQDKDELKACELAGWVVDVRGQKATYKDYCLTAYNNLRQAKPDTNLSQSLFETIKAIAPRPLKPGFFRMNQTDKRRFKKVAHQAQGSADIVGQVLDVVAKKRVTILLKQPLQLGEQLAVLHPKVSNLELLVTTLWDIDNCEISQAKTGALVQLPWIKGIQQHALLQRIKINTSRL